MLQIFSQTQHQLIAQNYWAGLLNNFMTNSLFDNIFYTLQQSIAILLDAYNSHTYQIRYHNQSWTINTNQQFSCMCIFQDCIFPIVINIRIISWLKRVWPNYEFHWFQFSVGIFSVTKITTIHFWCGMEKNIIQIKRLKTYLDWIVFVLGNIYHGRKAGKGILDLVQVVYEMSKAKRLTIHASF